MTESNSKERNSIVLDLGVGLLLYMESMSHCHAMTPMNQPIVMQTNIRMVCIAVILLGFSFSNVQVIPLFFS